MKLSCLKRKQSTQGPRVYLNGGHKGKYSLEDPLGLSHCRGEALPMPELPRSPYLLLSLSLTARDTPAGFSTARHCGCGGGTFKTQGINSLKAHGNFLKQCLLSFPLQYDKECCKCFKLGAFRAFHHWSWTSLRKYVPYIIFRAF